MTARLAVGGSGVAVSEVPATVRAMHNTNPLLVVIDGNSIGHRAWHGYSRTQMTCPMGQPTHALHGFLTITAGVLEKLPVAPAGIIFAFDGPENARRARWPEYKANRSARDADLTRQLEELPRLLTDAGGCVERPRHWEADDVCASAAAAAAAEGWQCIIATSDRDAFALIDDTTRVLRLGNGIGSARLYDCATLVDDIGVHPSQYMAYAALRGDSSDNLPGVPGVGEKTAAKIVAAAAVPDIAANPDQYTPTIGKAAAAKVVAHLDTWRHNVEVMTPNRDLTMDLRAVTLEGFDPDRLLDACAPYAITVSAKKFSAALTGVERHTDEPLSDDPGEYGGTPPYGEYPGAADAEWDLDEAPLTQAPAAPAKPRLAPRPKERSSAKQHVPGTMTLF